MNQIRQKLETEHLKKRARFRVGDSVSVHTRIIEGEKERVQVFTGTVIARRGRGLSETFSVHRVAYGEGMERVFLLHSPLISKIEVVREGRVRRAKLYYLRGTSGKKAKVRARGGAGVIVRAEEEEELAAEPVNTETTQGNTANEMLAGAAENGSS